MMRISDFLLLRVVALFSIILGALFGPLKVSAASASAGTVKSQARMMERTSGSPNPYRRSGSERKVALNSLDIASPVSSRGSAVLESQAETLETEVKSTQKIGLSIGYQYGNFTYSEAGMKDSGHLHGIGLLFRKPLSGDSLLLRMSGELLMGQLSYEGSLVELETGVKTPHRTQTFDVLTNVSSTLGMMNRVGVTTELTPFAGLGLRYLNDRMKGEGAYEREISYLLAPIGVELATRMGRSARLGLVVEYDLLLAGMVKSHLSDVGVQDMVNTQTQGQGFRVAADIGFGGAETSDWRIQPYYQYWHVADSDKQRTGPYLLWEPENKSEQFGVVLAVGL